MNNPMLKYRDIRQLHEILLMRRIFACLLALGYLNTKNETTDTTGATSAALSGGNIGQGAIIGFFAGMAGGAIGTFNINNVYVEGLVQVATSAAVGGAASEATGGTFWKGFEIGAISATAAFAANYVIEASTNSQASSGDALNVNEADSVQQVREILGATDEVRQDADQYWRDTGKAEMIPVKGPGGAKFEQIKAICAQAGSGCGHPFDLKAGSQNAIKFETDTLHIRYDSKVDRITYHWDRYNMNVAPIRHIAVDVIWNFVRGGGL